MPTRTPVALALIVKNEAPTIATTLESARRALGPGPTVVHDTGSTDGTGDVVHEWAEASGAWLHWYQRPFDDFASARNACLADAFEHAPIVCMVDAGVVVRGAYVEPVCSPERMRDSAWDVTVRLGKCTFPRPQLFTRGWHYVGKVHEYAEGPGERVGHCGLEFDYCLRDEERPKRWLRDLALLEGDFTPRGRFYYAQTLELVGRRTQALAANLERAAMTDGWFQERAVAYARAANLAPTITDAELYTAHALQVDPTRGDFYLALCERYEHEQMWSSSYAAATRAIMLVPRADALFARADREARANVYAGDAASSQGKYALAREHWLRALAVGGLDADTEAEVRAAVEAGS